MDAENKNEKISTANEISGGVQSLAATDESSEISLENLDQLLGENDPDFAAQMMELEASVKNEDVQIVGATDVLAQVGSTLEADAADKTVPENKKDLLSKIKRRFGFLTIGSRISSARALHEAKDQVQGIGSTSRKVLKQYNGRDWKLIFLFCFTLFTMGFAFRVVKPVLDHWLKGDFFGNYEKVADQIFEEGPKAKMRSFRDPLEEFNFIVQYERTIVNLKPSMNSTSNPMSTFVIYVEGTSRETAVELKDRQMEIRDICQRVAEGMTYDEFVSAEGKRRFKNLVRKNVNEILNSGHLRAVYFDTVIVKP